MEPALLLLRRRWAFPLFLIAAAAFVVDQAYVVAKSSGEGQLDVAGWIFSALILGVMLGLAVYSRWMTKRGVLR